MGIFDFLFGNKKKQEQEKPTSIKPKVSQSQPSNPQQKTVLKKWDKPISLDSLFKKSISFHVERFEEWQAGQCINKGLLDFDIHLIAKSDQISVDIPQATKFNLTEHASFNFNESQVLDDRIQYCNAPFSSTDPTRPILLHIFVKNEKIEYIRFAMSFPDRIVEFYGTQIISETSNPKNFNVVTCKASDSDDYKLTFLSSLINVASCDGEIAETEMETIMTYLQREGLSHADFINVATNPSSVPHIVPQDPNLRIQHIRDVVILSMVDGTFDPREYSLCKQIAVGLGFKPEIVDKIRQELNIQIGRNI